MKLKLSFILSFIYVSLWAQPPHTFTANGTVVVPAGITTMNIQAWGAGGAGGGASDAELILAVIKGRGGAGGGGGAYASATITVVADNPLNVVVAGQTPGTTGDGANGGSSTITGFESTILAAGGSGGLANTTGNSPLGGSGGTVGNSVAVGGTKTAGTNGGNGANPIGGTGLGGAARSSLALGTGPGFAGSPPGGGGSGAINSVLGASQPGGTGAHGQVIVTYTCPTYNITGISAQNGCITFGTSLVTLTSSAALLPTGTYTVTYSRSNPSATGLTTTMTVSTAGTGTFTASGLALGTNTITVTNLASAACTSNITTNNVATNVIISPAVVGGSVTGGTTICSGFPSALLTLSGHTGTVVKWQYSISPFSTWTDILTATGTTYTSGTLTQTTQFRAEVQSGTCGSADSNFTTVTVNPLPAITLGAVAPVCTSAGAQNTTLAYSGATNAPTTYSITWNASPTNTFAPLTDVALSASPISIAVPAGTAAGTYTGTLTVKNANSCTSSPGVTFNVVVNPLPSAPVIGTITPATCLVSTGSIALSGLPVGGTLTLYPGAIVEPYSGTTVTISGLTPNTYTFIVNNGTCTSLVSANAVLPGLVTNIFTTSWSNGTPTIDQNLVFAGDYASAGGGVGNINGCSCTVNSGVNVIIQFLDTLTLTYSLSNNGGTVTFENNSSLLQITNAVNSGNIIYKRIAPQIRQADYVYWSTPVNPQRLLDVSPLTSYDRFMAFNGDSWLSIFPKDNMIVGKGYIIRGPNGYSNTAKVDYTASFIGVPNNGNLSGETVAAGKFYLIGNPYPSALNANAFLTANPFLDGTLYFWTHNTSVVLSGAYRYNSDDYASYNKTGGVGLSAGSGNAGNNNSSPLGNIAAGQSFFASSINAGTIVFNNSMRFGGANNSQFFKSANTSETEIEKHRVWLNMTNDGGAFKQMLVGYVEGASNGYEDKYDGKSFDANPYLDFYSVGNGNNYVIQGRALPFTDTDSVPLGYRSTISGNFTIAIDHTDGDLSNHAIYLEDKITNTIQNLRAGNYTFNTSTGTFTNRFVLRYSNKSLGTDEFENPDKNISITVKNKAITVSSDVDRISTVYIYDLSGKVLHKRTNISDTILKIDNLKISDQVLLVKVILETNATKTYKIIY